MIEAFPGAEEFTATGQEYTGACRIVGILWIGSTVSGDAALVKGRGDSANRVMWAAQTDVGNTYLGAIWGPPGIHAPHGFKISALPGGRLLVYLSQ
jgi:hypothetical protein